MTCVTHGHCLSKRGCAKRLRVPQAVVEEIGSDEFQRRKEQLKAALAAGDRYEREAARLRDAGSFETALDATYRAREADAQAARLLAEIPSVRHLRT